MSEKSLKEIKELIGKHILALFDKNYYGFVQLFTAKIRAKLTNELFNEAVTLFQKVPLDMDAIDFEKTEFLTNEHAKLTMVNGRTFCNVIKEEGRWLVDDIYWNLKVVFPDNDQPQTLENQEIIETTNNNEEQTNEADNDKDKEGNNENNNENNNDNNDNAAENEENAQNPDITDDEPNNNNDDVNTNEINDEQE
ncbi:MAG: hypothetical protein ACTSU2_08630 [Promethearchaeota archaeon]